MKKLGLKNLIKNKIDKGDMLYIQPEEAPDIGTLEEEENRIIDEVLDDIWDTYNDDGNEHLDREEMEKFIYVTLIETGIRSFANLEELKNDEKFQACFLQFDEDNSGEVSR